jgi:hypothetical protein
MKEMAMKCEISKWRNVNESAAAAKTAVWRKPVTKAVGEEMAK